MENKDIVFADKDKRERREQTIPHAAIMVFCGVGIALALFIIAGAWYLIGFTATFVVIVTIVTIGAGALLLPRWEHHQHDKADRKHIRHLSQIAIENGHSVEYKPATRELRTISPFTIPNAPVTIKDNTFGTEQAQLPPGLPTAPAFSSLISQIRPGHLFLAQGAKPIWGDITDLLSTLDVGRPGTGKSTLLRMVCGQVLLIGGKPIIFDPHGSILDDLGSQFECAETPGDILTYSRMLDTHLTQRLYDRRLGQTDFKPLLLLADEMPIISEMSPDALPTIRRVVLEGRKVGMYALIAGQGVPSSILGGTLVRDAMASRYVFCTTPQQARLAGIENETAKSMMAILEDAGPGKAVLATASRKPEIVAIPDTTTDDIRLLLDRKRGNAPFPSVETAIEADLTASGNAGNVSQQSDDVSIEESVSDGNAIRETVKRLRRGGLPLREIAPLVGMAGRKYEQFKRLCEEEGIA